MKRVGVVGIGAIAPLHINALQTRGENIVALCDIDVSRCQAAIKEFGLSSRIYKDYTEMLDKEELDVVHICTPHYLHAPMSIAALNKGVNVLCEKPLAITEAQLDDLEEAVKSSNSFLGVCHQNRFKASLLYVKELIGNRAVTAATASLIWERNEEYYKSGEWRGKWATEGGGVMINQAIHSLDVLQWLCGMPETVKAEVSNHSLKDVIEVEDTAYGIFGLMNGGNFIINATNAAKFPFPIYYMFRCGEDTIEVSNDNIIINDKVIHKSDDLPIFGKEVWGVGHVNLIREYYDCLQTGKKFPVDYYEGRKVIKLILKMYQSKGELLTIE